MNGKNAFAVGTEPRFPRRAYDWRKELAEHLFAAQQQNGSWVNSQSDRWYEQDPNLVTAYVLAALSHCR